MRKGELVLIYLPNKFERFSIGLRNHIQRLSPVGGPTVKQRGILRRLHLAKSLIDQEEETPVDINVFCGEMLRAVQIIKIESETGFSFAVNSKETFLIKKHIFESLLLTVCKESSYVRIISSKNSIAIFAENVKGEILEKIIGKLNGNILTEIKSGRGVIFLKGCLTTKTGISVHREIDYLKDPYSVVNLYIKE